MAKEINISIDVENREDRLNLRLKVFEGITSLSVSLDIKFTTIVKKEVDHFGILARFAEEN